VPRNLGNSPSLCNGLIISMSHAFQCFYFFIFLTFVFTFFTFLNYYLKVSISIVLVKLFADDMNLFLHSADSESLFATANINMATLYEWFTANRLSVNLDKTRYSIFVTVMRTLQL